MVDQIGAIVGIIIGVMLIAIPIALNLRKKFMDTFGDKLDSLGLLAREAKNESVSANKRTKELETMLQTQSNYILNLEGDVRRGENKANGLKKEYRNCRPKIISNT